MEIPLKTTASGGEKMPRTLHGRVYGKTIELNQDSGIPDGQDVEVALHTTLPVTLATSPGDGIRQSAGPLPDDSSEDDHILAQIQQARHAARWREVQG